MTRSLFFYSLVCIMSKTQEDIEPIDKPHILVVDDDERLRELLSRYLGEHGFLVTTALDALDARKKLKTLLFDMIVLDVMMPGESGLSLTTSLKAENDTPILLLTALGETENRIEGLESGADDYLSKPFEPRELVLRIKSILRRHKTIAHKNTTMINFGNWVFHIERGELSQDEKAILLTTAEIALLRTLAQKPGEIVSREDLAEAQNLPSNERAVDVQVTRLRKKIEEDPKNPRHLQTIRGKGYILWTN